MPNNAKLQETYARMGKNNFGGLPDWGAMRTIAADCHEAGDKNPYLNAKLRRFNIDHQPRVSMREIQHRCYMENGI